VNGRFAQQKQKDQESSHKMVIHREESFRQYPEENKTIVAKLMANNFTITTKPTSGCLLIDR
jgi:hypothetical protein